MAKFTQLIRQRFLRFRREVVVLAYAVRHPSTPWYLKVASLLLALYLLSPIDLIPIFVPVLGLLDDLIIVPFGVSQVVKRLPQEARQQSEASADKWIKRYVKYPLLALLLVVLLLVGFWAVVLYWLLT